MCVLGWKCGNMCGTTWKCVSIPTNTSHIWETYFVQPKTHYQSIPTSVWCTFLYKCTYFDLVLLDFSLGLTLLKFLTLPLIVSRYLSVDPTSLDFAYFQVIQIFDTWCLSPITQKKIPHSAASLTAVKKNWYTKYLFSLTQNKISDTIHPSIRKKIEIQYIIQCWSFRVGSVFQIKQCNF